MAPSSSVAVALPATFPATGAGAGRTHRARTARSEREATPVPLAHTERGSLARSARPVRDASVPAGSEPAYDNNLESAAAVVAAWCGESLLHAGEDPARALAPGTARRGALDAALREIDLDLARPSADFRRRFALMLGLERILSEPTPSLASGLTLRAHQVDALAGMLAALIGDFERGEDEEHEDDEHEDEVGGVRDRARRRARGRRGRRRGRGRRRRGRRVRSPTRPSTRRTPTSPRRSTPRQRRPIRARAAATASSTPPRRARPSRRPASSTPAARPAS